MVDRATAAEIRSIIEDAVEAIRVIDAALRDLGTMPVPAEAKDRTWARIQQPTHTEEATTMNVTCQGGAR